VVTVGRNLCKAGALAEQLFVHLCSESPPNASDVSMRKKVDANGMSDGDSHALAFLAYQESWDAVP
jgi:hypothetical protein